MIDIPKTITRELSDAERFVEGLKILAKECNMTNISYCGFGPISFTFADGTSIGGKRAWIDAGIIKQEQ